MDLRTQKTLSSIRNTFIELRSKKPLSKITIKELTEKALISKPTFYLHYHDIYDLSDSMENEIINNIISSYPLDFEKTDSPYNNWLSNLIQSFVSQGQLLNILFSNDRKHIFVTKLNSAFKEHIFSAYPHLKNNINLGLYLDYAIYGTFQAYIQNINLPQDKLVSTLVLYNERLLTTIYDLITTSSDN